MDLQVLRDVDLFKGLDPVMLAHIASITTEKQFPKGTIIFKEGDPAEDFFVIDQGRVRVFKVVPGMGEEALAILDQGTYFGEMEMIDEPKPRAAQAVAHEDCVLQCVRYEDFHTLLNTNNELALAILWNISAPSPAASLKPTTRSRPRLPWHNFGELIQAMTMRTANPALSNRVFVDARRDVGFAGAHTETMTVLGTVHKTGVLLSITLGAAMFSWSRSLQAVDPRDRDGVCFHAAFVDLGIWAAWSPPWSPFSKRPGRPSPPPSMPGSKA